MWVCAGRQFLRTCSMRSPARTRITADRRPQTAKPPEGGFEMGELWTQAWPLITCCSSPDSYMSIMMSEPPMNSPLM